MIRIATSRGGAKLGVLGLLVLAALVGFVPMAQATPMVKHSPSLMAAGTPGSEAIGNTTTESATLSGAFFPSPVPAGYTY
ncbi:MAG TPA: hypothetical protein VHV82_06455, partial [Sporichthyaceae bacterium]|nr:hypothetical protein [Sporichthyaceae bacterium]